MSDRLPPWSKDSEEAVLGCILTDAEYSFPLLEKEGISNRHFFDGRYSNLFLQLAQFHSERVLISDLSVLFPKLKAAGSNIEPSLLTSLQDKVPSARNLPHYLPELKSAFARRMLLKRGQTALDIALDQKVSLEALLDSINQFDEAARHSFGRNKLPEIEDASNLTRQTQEKPPELVYGLLHKGSKLVLGGGSKSFKTWTLTDLALSVAYGEPWLSFKTARGKVLYLNLELQSWSFADRLHAVAKSKGIKIEPGALEIWNLRGYSASYDVLLPKIKKRIEQAGHSLIVLDPVYKLLGNLDENSAGDMGKLMNSLEDLATQTGAAIAFGAHFSKGNQSSKESIDRISGSGVFARDPDSIITFSKHEQERAFTVDCTLRNFKPTEPFVVRWDFPQFRRDDQLDPRRLKQAPKGGRSPEYSEAELLDLLPKKGFTTSEWQQEANSERGITRPTFYRLLKTINASQAVMKNEKGKWVKSQKSQNPSSDTDTHLVSYPFRNETSETEVSQVSK
jgi:hypothetical protein